MMEDWNGAEVRETRIEEKVKKAFVSPMKSSRPTAYVKKALSARAIGSLLARHDAPGSFNSPRDFKGGGLDCRSSFPHSSRPSRSDQKKFEPYARFPLEPPGGFRTPEAPNSSVPRNGTNSPSLSADAEGICLLPLLTTTETRLPALDGYSSPSTVGGSVVVWAGGRRRQQHLQRQPLGSWQPTQWEDEEVGVVPQAEKNGVFSHEGLGQEARGLRTPLTVSPERSTGAVHEHLIHSSHMESASSSDTAASSERMGLAQHMSGMEVMASPICMDAEGGDRIIFHRFNLTSSPSSSSSSWAGASSRFDRDETTETELVTVVVRGEDAGMDGETNTRRREASHEEPGVIQREGPSVMMTRPAGRTGLAQLDPYRRLPGYREARRTAQRMALERLRQFGCSGEGEGGRMEDEEE